MAPAVPPSEMCRRSWLRSEREVRVNASRGLLSVQFQTRIFSVGLEIPKTEFGHRATALIAISLVRHDTRTGLFLSSYRRLQPRRARYSNVKMQGRSRGLTLRINVYPMPARPRKRLG
jgi:hypothetical protein